MVEFIFKQLEQESSEFVEGDSLADLIDLIMSDIHNKRWMLITSVQICKRR